MIFPRIDIHTHDHSRVDSAIINISPNEDILPGTYYSMGIHPWDTATVTQSMLDALTSKAHNKQIVAIGETGLDALSGGEIASQTEGGHSEEADVRANHDHVTMGEVQHFCNAVDHGVAQCDHGINTAQTKTVDQG